MIIAKCNLRSTGFIDVRRVKCKLVSQINVTIEMWVVGIIRTQ